MAGIMADDLIVLDLLMNDESDHESSDEADDMLLFNLAQNANRENVPKVQGFVENVVDNFVTIRGTLHTEARFVPDSPLPRLPFWLQFALLDLRQFLKTYKNVSVHVSL